jgi:hypothetical protein
MRELYGSAAPTSVVYVDASDGAVQMPQDSDNGRIPTSQSYGDIASGSIIAELDGKLYLDTRPCTGRIATFAKPYRKIPIGPASCGDKKIDRFQVEERRK